MPDIIFARPDYNYDSYNDLYRIIVQSGFPLVHFNEMQVDNPDHCYIMTILNGENQQGWPDARARLILYDLEWRLNGDYPRIPGVREIWAADAWYAEQIGARYVLLGSHPGLNDNPAERRDKEYDYAMMAYMMPRRQGVQHEAKKRGVTFAPNGWQEQRHEALLKSRAMLHVHQHETIHTVAPQRWAIAAAYRLPVISESVIDKGDLAQVYGLFADFDDLPDFLATWKDDRRLAEYGEWLYNFLCVERSFRKNVEAAV